jgi:hypothetical protein
LKVFCNETLPHSGNSNYSNEYNTREIKNKNMRKVKFKKWIPPQYNAEVKRIEGTNCWESDYVNEGLFHQWGNSYEEFESGAGNFTVAIVELPDGTIGEILPSNIKFIEQ